LEVWAASAEATARLLLDPSGRDGRVTAHTLVSAILQQCNEVFDRHQKCFDEEYVNDDAFRYLVNEMLDAVAWGEEKKQLWMQDKSQYLVWLEKFSLRECHRVWQMFLRKSIANAKIIQPDDRNGCDYMTTRLMIFNDVTHDIIAHRLSVQTTSKHSRL
jgi:hypothetical protein